MSNFTSGPWSVEDRRHAPLKNIRIVSGTTEIAQVSHVHQRDELRSNWDHKQADAIDAVGIANAHMIAAAPDLLAALINLLEWQVLQSINGSNCYPQDYIDAARAAIAKAYNYQASCVHH